MLIWYEIYGVIKSNESSIKILCSFYIWVLLRSIRQIDYFYTFMSALLYLHVSAVIPSRLRCYTFMSPLLYLHVSAVIPSCLRCYTFMSPLLYIHVSAVIPSCLRCYTFMSPLLYLHVSAVISSCLRCFENNIYS
mgnify:CR=1 FL=1